MVNSWGNYPKVSHQKIVTPHWRDETIPFASCSEKFLAYGQGRSYGDCCLNENGVLISTSKLNRLIDFDKENGILECEAGITLKEILEFITPHSWFLSVLPGTQFVSLGGAIANDVHGKNHHTSGTFGKHVISFELLRSTGEKVICSSFSNQELFRATIGGMGLTGVILSARIKLKSIPSSFLSVNYISFQNLEEFFVLSKKAEKHYEYTVAWLDCVADGKNFGRGIFMCANHNENSDFIKKPSSKFKLKIPFYFPGFVLNALTIKNFNNLYLYFQSLKENQIIESNKFFFPLDEIKNWNKIYGKKGFVQYQCVLPESASIQIKKVLRAIVSAGQGSFLSVLKTFGDSSSPGMMSFPTKGVTLALDFPYRGAKTHELLNKLDKIVMEYGGKVYPAKDANMSSQAFKNYFPQWDYFSQFIDPKISSSLWRRVTQHET